MTYLAFGSDFHLDQQLVKAALGLQTSLGGYIYLGDFCDWAGYKAEQFVGCHPMGLKELPAYESFLRQLDAAGSPWLALPGNHEPGPSWLPTGFKHGRLITQIEWFEWLGLRVLAVPFTPACGFNWELTEQHLITLLGTKPSSVDLLITHAPPLGALDEGGQYYAGLPTLRPVVDLVQPRYYLCGHMHRDGGKRVKLGNTIVINTAQRNSELVVTA